MQIIGKKVLSFIFLSILCFVSNNIIFGDSNTLSFTFDEIGAFADGLTIIDCKIIDNELAFITEFPSGYFSIYNISNPANCFKINSYYFSHPHELEVDMENELAFIIHQNGLSILEISNFSHLQVLSTYTSFTYGTFFEKVGSLLFIGVESEGLHVVNISNPLLPTFLGNWTDPESGIGPIYINDQYAFVATRLPVVGGGVTPIALKVLNISDPANITFVSVAETGTNYGGGIPNANVNNLLYLADFEEGFKILNFTNPLEVKFIGEYFDGGIAATIQIINETKAFVADDIDGLEVLDCSNPYQPIEIASHQLQWRAYRLAIVENRIYIGTLGGGVRILAITSNTQSANNSILILSCLILLPIYLIYKNKINKSN